MIARSSTKFVNALAFSNGMAELTLKNPPPLVPSCLIATCEATGPTDRSWSAPSTVFAVTAWPMVWSTPPATKRTATTIDSGSRM